MQISSILKTFPFPPLTDIYQQQIPYMFHDQNLTKPYLLIPIDRQIPSIEVNDENLSNPSPLIFADMHISSMVKTYPSPPN